MGLAVHDTCTGEDRSLLVTGVFVAIGHVPNTTLVTGQVDLAKRLRAHRSGCFTNVDGLFAAGDVTGPRLPPGRDLGGIGLYRGDRRRALA